MNQKIREKMSRRATVRDDEEIPHRRRISRKNWKIRTGLSCFHLKTRAQTSKNEGENSDELYF
jgi:hypothetical protein